MVKCIRSLPFPRLCLQSEDAVVVFARSCGSVCNKQPLHTMPFNKHSLVKHLSLRLAEAPHGEERVSPVRACASLHDRRTESRPPCAFGAAALVDARKTAQSSASSTNASTDIGGNTKLISDHYQLMTRRPALVHTIADQLLHSAPSISAVMARYRRLCHVSGRFRPIMEG